MTKRVGKLEYTDRAFRQDAEDAIKGDVIRALIELITNADDAYDSKGGEIQISVKKAQSPYQVVISVQDKATGLTADGLEKAFTRLGDLNQKFINDVGTRGLFGRGAKDVAALGKVKFVSICQGKFSVLEIDSSQGKQYEIDPVDEIPSESNYERCNLSKSESGLTAELYVASVHKVPTAVDMVDKLQSHVQLRDLINRNSVTYFDERSNTKLILKGIAPKGEIVFSQDIAIPLYKHPIILEVLQFTEKKSGSISPYSQHGLVISGKGAAYENSFLGLTNRPEAGWFCGRIDAPEIHDLARDHEKNDEISDLNPSSIISRQRDGLARNHPYYRALAAEVEKVLKPIFDEAEANEGGKRREGEQLRKKLAAISQTLANTLQQILDESDAGDLPIGTSKDDPSPEVMQFIPPRKYLKIGETTSLSLRAPLDMDVSSLEHEVISSTGKFILEEIESDWKAHSRLAVKQCVVKVKATEVGTAKLISATTLDRAEAELISVFDIPPTEVEPTTLEFATSKVRVSPTKARNLILRAPHQFNGETVSISASGEVLEFEKTCILKPSSNKIYAEAIVRIIAGDELGKVMVSATLNEDRATCEVEVIESGQGKVPKIAIQIVGNDNPPRRVDTLPDAGQLLIKIYGKHKSLTRIFGKPTDAGFELDSTPVAQATIGEIVASQLAIYAVERDSERHPERYSDASSVFFKQQEFLPKFVLALQAGLLEID